MKDKEINQEESLQVIHTMIDMTKNKMNETGFHFILWGILVTLASLSQFVMIKNGVSDISNIVWIVMSAVGAPIAIIYEYKRSKKDKTQSKFDRIYGFLWLGFGITLALNIFISLSFNVNPIAFILGIVGLATFMSGVIYRFTPLIIGALVFWLCSGICPYISHTDQLLINAIAILVGYIVPGILIWNKNKKDV